MAFYGNFCFTVDGIIVYLQMDGKRGHVTCGNRLAIEREKSFKKFANFEEELLFHLCLGLLRPYKISHCLIDLGKNYSSSIKWKYFLKSLPDVSYILAKEVGWPGYKSTFLL